jgi:N-acetylglutamate synthase-like GNAT family acetyltransferase
MSAFQIRELNKNDKDWVIELLTEHWGSARVVSRGRVHQADALPGFVAIHGCKPAGLITYNIEGKECEITTMNSIVEKMGIGTALIDAMKAVAGEKGCKRLWLITTNDNTHALRFYQKYGFKISAINVNAIEQSRKIKPEIPLTGNDDIPIRDEIELEMMI